MLQVLLEYSRYHEEIKVMIGGAALAVDKVNVSRISRRFRNLVTVVM